MNITFAYNPHTNCTHISVDGVHHQELEDARIVEKCDTVEDAIVEMCDGAMTIDVKEVESFACILLQTSFPMANISFELMG